MKKHHEELLKKILTRDVDLKNPLVLEARKQSPEFDRQVQQFVSMQADLDRAGLAMLDEIAHLNPAETQAVDRQMRVFGERIQAAGFAGAAASQIPWWQSHFRVVGMAAGFLAVLLAGLWWANGRNAAPDSNQGVLGTERSVEQALPQGRGASFDLFQAPLVVRNMEIEFEVYDASSGALLQKSGRLQSNRWEPASTELWPAAIQWRWTAYRTTGDLDRSNSSPGLLSAQR